MRSPIHGADIKPIGNVRDTRLIDNAWLIALVQGQRFGQDLITIHVNDVVGQDRIITGVDRASGRFRQMGEGWTAIVGQRGIDDQGQRQDTARTIAKQVVVHTFAEPPRRIRVTNQIAGTAVVKVRFINVTGDSPRGCIVVFPATIELKSRVTPFSSKPPL